MAVYLPPMTKKKSVPEKYNPDTFRVISQDAEDQRLTWRESPVDVLANQDELRPERHTPYLYSRETQVLPQPMPDFRANKPHPESNDFLRCNVLVLNEPICNVHTESSQEEQPNWWPSRTSDAPLDTPPYTINTTFREDFKKRKPLAPGATRHVSNPNTEPSRGAVPVNQLRGPDGKQSLWKEGLSYEHQYNCRLDPSYPIRAKRHGAFVWDKMNAEDSQRFIDYYSKVSEEEMSRSNNNVSQEPVTNCDVNWPHSNPEEQLQGETTTAQSNNCTAEKTDSENNLQH